ncbi:MAG TPA: lytic murein transglycosylase B [Woeseiaceae bacterium]|nr:lytic murein transglycosylase B [Woeseiaceae bacterium]
MNTIARILLVLAVSTGSSNARAIDTNRADVQAFVTDMVTQHGYDRARLIEILAGAESQAAILEAISTPAERTLSWLEYRDIFLTDKRVTAGAEFWREHFDTLQRISRETGVSCEVLVGIIGVETFFGRITGKYRVLDALATLAFDYPPRAGFFRRELEEFLLLASEEQMDPADATGSYAGAMGAPQFMPSSFRAYAVDANADGKRDIWTDWADVIGSVANYFVAHGWQRDREVAALASLADNWQGKEPDNSLRPRDTVASLSHSGVLFATDLDEDEQGQLLKLDGAGGEEYWVGFHNFFVITRYNHSVMYALAVYQLGREIALKVQHGDV